MSGINGALGLFHGSIETKGFVDNLKIRYGKNQYINSSPK
jgi:hypothetical protein